MRESFERDGESFERERERALRERALREAESVVLAPVLHDATLQTQENDTRSVKKEKRKTKLKNENAEKQGEGTQDNHKD